MKRKKSEIELILNRVGKGTFIKYFHLFKQKLNNYDLINKFKINNEKWKESSYNTKAANGRKIFEMNGEVEALELVIKSNSIRVGGGIGTIKKAKLLLNKYKEKA